MKFSIGCYITPGTIEILPSIAIHKLTIEEEAAIYCIMIGWLQLCLDIQIEL